MGQLKSIAVKVAFVALALVILSRTPLAGVFGLNQKNITEL